MSAYFMYTFILQSYEHTFGLAVTSQESLKSHQIFTILNQ